MRGYSVVEGLFFGGLIAVGCAGRTPAAQAPTAGEVTEEAPHSGEPVASSDPTSSGQSLDVGMEFKDKGDDEPRRANREAPPTATWKPMEKEKAADPKKSAVTASR